MAPRHLSTLAVLVVADRTGRVVKATIGDPGGMLQPDERACITKKLMLITSPCPTATPLPGYARVTFEIRAP